VTTKKKGRCSLYSRQLQRFIDEWRHETGADDVDMRLVAAWAINKGLWQPPRKTAVELLARDLSRAAREDYIEDDEGNPVRKRHAYRVKQGDQQLTIWVDIDTAKPGQMRLSVLQRRLGIVGDCIQLQHDVNYYDSHNKHGAKLPQLSLDFGPDVTERNLPTEYPDAPPEDDELDDAG